MGNNKSIRTTTQSSIVNYSVDGVYKHKSVYNDDQIFIDRRYSGHSSDSINSYHSTNSWIKSSLSRRNSKRRFNESNLTLTTTTTTTTSSQSLNKTNWPTRKLETIFLPEFPLNINKRINLNNFLLIKLINKGAFGRVYLIKNQQDNQQYYAIKILKKSKIIEEDSIKQVKEEVQIQRACGHHSFIVNCPYNWQSKNRLFIVTDYVCGGELFELLKKYQKLPEVLIKLYIAQLALAIDFLHNAGVIYRDLKPENILLDSNGNIQLIDFGLSKWLPYGKRTKTICGTHSYMERFEMNARSQVFDLTVEGRQADEAVASLFHTILFHRTLGKFLYSGEDSYSIGTVGYTDVDCDFIDLTYVCCSSKRLDQTLKREINNFSEQLRYNNDNSGTGIGQISLEFFQKKSQRWMFQSESIPWEVWTIRLELITLNNEGERQLCREKVGELLTDKIFYIAEIMNRHEFVPQMPSQSDLDLIFDTSYQDIQPYLFKLNYSISGPSSSTSVGSTVKKFFKDTLTF